MIKQMFFIYAICVVGLFLGMFVYELVVYFIKKCNRGKEDCF